MFKKTGKIIINFFIVIIFLSCFLIVKSKNTEAAVLSLSPSSSNISVGNIIVVNVLVNTQDKIINNAEVSIQYPVDLMEVVSLSKNSSIFSLWVEEPKFSNITGKIFLNGGVPSPGFIGSNGSIVSVVFKAKKQGVASIIFSDSYVRQNDGLGTDILTVKNTSSIKIEDVKRVETKIPQKVENKDSVKKIENIKITPLDTSMNIPEEPLDFNLTSLSVPIVTYYQNDLYIDDFLILKGVADPSVNIELEISNLSDKSIITGGTLTDINGKFTFVSDAKMPTGTYYVKIRSRSLDGIVSGYTNSLQIVVREKELNSFISIFSKYITAIIPVVALLILLVILLIYGFYHLKKFHIYLNKKLLNTENIVGKSFEILDEDEDEEISIFRKISRGKVLDEDERFFLDKFKKDIKEAEKIIQKELKEIEKENNK